MGRAMEQVVSNEIAYEDDGQVAVIRLRGRVTSMVAEALFDALARPPLNERSKIVMSLGGIEYLASAGIGALVRLTGERQVKLAAPSEVVRRALGLAEVYPLFEVYASETEAAKAFAGT